MKINAETWAKLKTHWRFYVWPMAISAVCGFFYVPISQALSISIFWMTLLPVLVWIPFLIVDARRLWKVMEYEKQQTSSQA